MGSPPASTRALRSVGAVLAGLLVVVVLSIATDAALRASGVFPAPGQRMSDGLFALATAYRIVYAVAGGYVAARLASGRPLAHSIALGVVGFVLSLAGALATWNATELGPRWYPLALVVIAVPSSWLGGRLRLMQIEPRSG